MKPFLFKWLTAVFAVALLSSIVSMMATFVGSQGADLQDLLALQVVLAQIAVTVAIGCFGLLIRRYGYRGADNERTMRTPINQSFDLMGVPICVAIRASIDGCPYLRLFTFG